jgi:hypothetical protein
MRIARPSKRHFTPPPSTPPMTTRVCSSQCRSTRAMPTRVRVLRRHRHEKCGGRRRQRPGTRHFRSCWPRIGAAQCCARLGVCAGRLMDMVLPVEEAPTNCGMKWATRPANCPSLGNQGAADKAAPFLHSACSWYGARPCDAANTSGIFDGRKEGPLRMPHRCSLPAGHQRSRKRPAMCVDCGLSPSRRSTLPRLLPALSCARRD